MGGDRHADYYGTVYLAQLLSVLKSLNADCLVITTLPGERSRTVLGSITISNIPMRDRGTGAAYHIAMTCWSLRCIAEILRFRPRVAILTAGQNYFWIFAGLRFMRVKLFASFHCTLWPKLIPQRPASLVLNWLNGRLFLPACDHIQGVSQDIIDQVNASSTRLRAPPKKFVPTYDANDFDAAEAATFPNPGSVFRCLYVGRIEENKGVFDLVSMMRSLHQAEPGRYHLTMCGTGSANRELDDAVKVSQLEQVITVSGQCGAERLAAHYAACHVVLVPTRSTFEEGYAKVVAEAILNLRPVITSEACPALNDVAKAAIEAKVDAPETYVDAVRKLANNPVLYGEKVIAAAHIRSFYFDKNHSYGAIIGPPLRKFLSALS